MDNDTTVHEAEKALRDMALRRNLPYGLSCLTPWQEIIACDQDVGHLRKIQKYGLPLDTTFEPLTEEQAEQARTQMALHLNLLPDTSWSDITAHDIEQRRARRSQSA